MDAAFWEEMYRGSDQVFSGNPNGVLVAEVADLPPGQALDVGCGEGADALWLAQRGWQVTAVDISWTALRRAATTGADAAGRVAWTRISTTAGNRGYVMNGGVINTVDNPDEMAALLLRRLACDTAVRHDRDQTVAVVEHSLTYGDIMHQLYPVLESL